MTRDALPSQVTNFLKAGKKVEAIKQLRFMTGVGLKEAKDRIDAYERGAPAPSPSDRPTVRGSVASFVIPPAAIEAVKRGNLIEAIKIVRETAGGSLAEAKALVEEIQRRAASGAPQPNQPRGGMTSHPPAPRALVTGQHLAPGEVPRGGGAGKWVALLAIAAVMIGAALVSR